MAILIAAFALMITGLSVWGVASPAGIVALVRSATGAGFMYIAVGTRVALALLLWFAAESARHPMVFKVLAVIAIIAAITIVLIGKARILKVFDWWAERSANAQRAWLLLGVGFGAYLLWAVWPVLAA